MALNTCKIKNIDSVNHIVLGVDLAPGDEYIIPDSKRIKAQNDNYILDNITLDKLQIGNGSSYITSHIDQVNWLKNIDATEKDSDGRPILRQAAASKGWVYLAMPIEFETSKLNSLYCKQEDLTDFPGVSIKFYDDVGVELTTELDITTSCEKTVVTFAPTFDYELVGGNIHQSIIPTSDVRIWVSGGILELNSEPYVKSFVSGINFKYIGIDDHISTDGRAAKFMQKTITGVPYQGNQLRFTVRHQAGYNHKIMILMEYFRA